MEIHEFIAIIVAGIAFILFGIVVWISCRHYNAINKLNSTLSSLGSTERIAIDVRDINLSVRIIAYIALAFCLGVVIHYLAIALPRIYEAKENAEKLQNFGVDYLGLIVAIFAIIVTLLVGWQIFSNIKERERFDKLTEANDEFKKNITEFRDGLDDRIKKLEKCCEDRGTAIFNLANEVNNSLDNAMIVLNTNIADIYKILFSGDDDLGYEFRFLSYRLAALQCADRLKKFHGCNIIVADINAFFDKVKNLTITPRSKQELINDMLEIQHSEQIIDFEKLKTNLENINVDPDAKGL